MTSHMAGSRLGRSHLSPFNKRLQSARNKALFPIGNIPPEKHRTYILLLCMHFNLTGFIHSFNALLSANMLLEALHACFSKYFPSIFPNIFPAVAVWEFEACA